MPVTVYGPYSSLAPPDGDLPSGSLDVGVLDEQIRASAIATTLRGVTQVGDQFSVEFEDALSSGDKDLLDGSTDQAANHPCAAGSILGDHSGPVSPPKIRAWTAEDGTEDVTAVDYIRSLSIRLQPVLTFDKGEVTRRDFFETAVLSNGQVVGTNLVVREDYVYNRDANGIVQSRDLTISWYADDDTVFTSKVRSKLYTPMEGLREGKRFRANVIDQLQIDTLFLIMTTEGWDEPTAQAAGASFMFSVQTETTLYVEADDKATLTAAINADTTHTWLDNVINPGPPAVTIRDYVIAGL
jgi:hypothetical protein